MLLSIVNLFLKILAFLILPPNTGQLSPDKIKRILVYGQMGIGNMVMFTPFLKTLRNYFPSSRIRVLFLSKNGAEQVLKGGNLVDEIAIWNYQDLTYRQRLKEVWRMAKWKPNLIVSRFASLPIDISLITLLSRAPYRVGHVSSGGWQGRYDYLNNYPVKMEETEHEIDRCLHLASDVGIPIVDKKMLFYISNDDEQFAQAFLRKHGINDREQFVTVQLGTHPVQSWKRWAMDKWSKLTDILLQNHMKVVATGSVEDRELIEQAFANLKIKPAIAAGELTLKQSAALIKRSSLLICHDTSLMHVAIAVDTPVVAIYGPTDYTRTAPVGDKHIIIRKELPCSPCLTMQGAARAEACRSRICLELITVEEVLAAIRQQLKIPMENTYTAGNYPKS